jgi:hypothetical protein
MDIKPSNTDVSAQEIQVNLMSRSREIQKATTVGLLNTTIQYYNNGGLMRVFDTKA